MPRAAGRRPRYPAISPKSYEHPADRAATAALGSIPLLDKVLKRLSEFRYERALEQVLLGDSVRISERQLPELHAAHQSSIATLDLEVHPELYISPMSEMNAFTVGSARPKILLNSGLIRVSPSEQLLCVLGHEDAHVLSDHVHYSTVLTILQQLLHNGVASVGRLPLQAVVLVLSEWYRCAELSCDRAAALVCDDPLAVCRTLMQIAGGGAPGLDLDAFIAQAEEYQETEDLLSRPGRFLSEMRRSHPFAVRRVAELTRWVREGEFDRIRSGSYVRRGEEPAPSAQLVAATEHYRTRFTEIVDRVAGGVQRLASQVADWLRSEGDDTGL